MKDLAARYWREHGWWFSLEGSSSPHLAADSSERKRSLGPKGVKILSFTSDSKPDYWDS